MAAGAARSTQKLASQVGRALQRLKAHQYFEYSVVSQGKLQWNRRADLIQTEAVRDGLYRWGPTPRPRKCLPPG